MRLVGCLECRKKLGVRVSGWRTQLKEGDGRQYVGLLVCRQMLKKLSGSTHLATTNWNLSVQDTESMSVPRIRDIPI